ncbi:hypothetical protein H2204_012395 [Knufia peltigerae]|uniref:Aspartate/glutamate racemase family protein n=1 Tax=Knufia peltigerae TaxID=1002370 RepID=A0AA39CR22_9EURO|nr:hypothetical protein H2204_012395 [Knufia peltigerae]
MIASQSDSLPPMGFISVECHFTRPAGDGWNERTWPFPLIREEAPGSLVPNLITDNTYDDDFLDRFVRTGQKLVDRGAVGIMTSCGFLAMAQPELARRLSVPVASSSLCQIPSLFSILPPTAHVGILTFDGSKLGRTHLTQLGITQVERVHIAGVTQDGHLQRLVRDDGPYSHEAIEKELTDAATAITQQHPQINTVVLECVQMAPFAVAVEKTVNMPVYDIYTMGCWFYSGLVRRRPEAWGPIGSDMTKG